MRPADTIVGRDAEVDGMSRFLEGVPLGPAALLIVGEAGIGKTTLFRAGLVAARDRSLRVLECHPSQADDRLSFGGLDDLLRDALGEVLHDLPSPQQRAIEVALLLDDAAGSVPDRRAIAVASLGVLRLLARKDALLVAVDDTQWLDRPTASVLSYALRRLRDERVGVLATVRRDEGSADPLEIERVLPHGRFHRLALGPLSVGALHRLIVERLGRALSRPALMRVHKTSGGNPFFALELARAILSSGGEVRPGQPLPVPEDLQELLRQRLAELPPEAADVLPVIAALADPTVEIVEKVLTRRRATAGLQAAVEADVLRVDGEHVRFAHPLLASAVYSRLVPRKRRGLHRRLASVGRDLEERARHLALGTDRPDTRVAEELEVAAAHASARGAPDIAGELAELAMALTPVDQPRRRWTRMMQTILYWITSGEDDRARVQSELLLAEAATPGERADALLLLAELRTDDFESSMELAEGAAAEASDDRRRLIRIHGLIADHRLIRGDLWAALDDARKALEFAELEGESTLLISAISRVAEKETLSGRRTPDLLERALALEEGNGSALPTNVFLNVYESPGFQLGLRLMWQDRLGEARERLLAAYTQGADAGSEPVKASALLHLTELECRAGNWELASRYATEGLEMAEPFGLEYQGGASLYPMALVDAYFGNAERARAAAQRGVDVSEAIGDQIFKAQNTSVLGFLELSLRDPAAADRHLRPLADWLEGNGWWEPSVYRVLPNAIEALIQLGELAEARRLLDRLEVRGREAESLWAEAAAGRCRGLILAAEGDLVGAISALEEALEMYDRIPGPFERARTLLALGTCRRRAKQKAAARRSIGDALATFRELGARLWMELAEAEVRRIGGRAPAPLELTPTERRVALLVTEGLTNREIADRLFVAVRTVEGHLSSVYRKLSVRSRTELARELRSSTEADLRASTEAGTARVKST